MEVFLQLLSHYGYVALFFLVLLGGTYIPIPSGLILIAVGALSHYHYFSIVLSFFIALAASITNNLLSYALARWIGKKERCRQFIEQNRHASRIQREFKKRPGRLVFISRFIGFVTMPVNACAGLSHMPLLPFLLFAALGDALCVAFYLAAGYTLGLAWAHDIQTTVTVLSILLLAGVIAYLRFFFISRGQKQRSESIEPS